MSQRATSGKREIKAEVTADSATNWPTPWYQGMQPVSASEWQQSDSGKSKKKRIKGTETFSPGLPQGTVFS